MAYACFTFDNMGEAAEIGAGRLHGPRPGGTDPSLQVGYPAVLDLLDRYAVHATFFIEGWNALHHPQEVAQLVERGHEVGMHGWVHEDWAQLDEEHERELAARASDALERACGVRPRGFRAPGGSRSAATMHVLADLGYCYDASLGDTSHATLHAKGMVQIPFSWSQVDGYYYLADPPAEPGAVGARWTRRLHRAAARPDGLFLTICHAFLTGTDTARLAALERVIASAVEHPSVEVATARTIAETVATHSTS